MKFAAAALCLALAACGTTYAVPEAGGPAVIAPVQGGSPRSPGDFARVAARVEPAAEAFCREAPGARPRATATSASASRPTRGCRRTRSRPAAATAARWW